MWGGDFHWPSAIDHSCNQIDLGRMREYEVHLATLKNGVSSYEHDVSGAGREIPRSDRD